MHVHGLLVGRVVSSNNSIVREEMRSIKKDTEQHPIALIVLSMVKSIPYVIPNTDVLRRFSVINGIGMLFILLFVYRVPLSTINSK